MYTALRSGLEMFVLSRMAHMILCFFLLSAFPNTATATISFEDVSKQSGIYHLFSTAGSAWGDLNGDGWPDLWVSNHWHQPPSLYLNQKNGTFVDIAADVLVCDLPADFHGAAWADFDNDGDQDLFVTTGGGTGRGICPNYLFVNQGGKLRNEASRFGVDYPLGRGRTPLWFDADRDGKLDLLLMNRFRGGKAPSAIFLQTANGFKSSNEKFGFNPSGSRTRLEKIADLLSNVIHLRSRKRAGYIKPAEVFAQLADLSGDHNIDLISYVTPMRVYSTKNIPFDEITNSLGFPPVGSAVQDIAIEDFSGDGQMDMFLARAFLTSDVTQINPLKVIGKIEKWHGTDHKGVRFRSRGEVTFNIYMPWRDPTDPLRDPPPVIAGLLDPMPADGRSFTLSPEDPLIQHSVALPDRSVSIEYDSKVGEWKVRTSYPQIHFIATSTEPIDHVTTIGFTPSKGELADILLVKGRDGFKSIATSGATTQFTTCLSVAAGDFDNDMDIDLYLVCTEPTQNIPNILYKNDGSGHFKEIPNAGGAAGSHEGRGNQVSVCDYDRDGFLDLFVTNGGGELPFSQGPHQLFHNKGNTNHWLEIDLQGTLSNRNGIGSEIELEAGGVIQLRSQGGGMHSFSQNHTRIHFGLGQNTQADRITIRWPSGVVQELREVAADQILKIIESATAQ